MTSTQAPAFALRGTPAAGAALAAPPLRPSAVPRTRLVRRLLAATDAPIALIVAPAGYGKTTLLSEWAARDERPFAWVSLTSGPGEDPVGAVLRLVEAAARSPVAQVIVADDAHVASDAAARRLLDAARVLPRGTTLAVASRACVAGGVGRLRAHGQLFELAAPDLAMTRLEAALLVDAAGARLDAAQLDLLLERTQGWPAALYLAARVAAGAIDPATAIAGFSGSDHTVADYLREEFLDALPEAERAFLRRTSILARLTAPACDAVLDGRGSGLLLSALARGGTPLEPLDRSEQAFRLHPLLAEMLRVELARLEPELAPVLHRRAARWLDRAGDPAEAIRHAVDSGDPHLAGRILWSLAPAYAAEGRAAFLGDALARFGEAAQSAQPTLALTAAVHHLATGRRGAAGRATDAAVRALGSAPSAGAGATVALLRACTARDDLARMAQDAARARDQLPPDSPWQGLALLLLGVAAQLAGDREAAREQLEEAASRVQAGIPAVAALAHAQLALLGVEARDWDQAAGDARRAHAALTHGAPDAASALVLATCAVVAAHRGQIAQARHDAADAERLLAPQADFPPWLMAEAYVWLARAQIRLSDGPAARTLLARAARLEPRVGGDSVLARWIHEGWERADAFAETATGDGPMLTNAELRVLRLLPSHMCFREIGQRLHVSTNTVKTQARAVYRKLDVACRSDAVARGRSAGLIGSS